MALNPSFAISVTVYRFEFKTIRKNQKLAVLIGYRVREHHTHFKYNRLTTTKRRRTPPPQKKQNTSILITFVQPCNKVKLQFQIPWVK